VSAVLIGIVGVEHRGAAGVERTDRLRQPLVLAAGEDDLGRIGARVARSLELDPALPPITTTVCPRSAGSRWAVEPVVASMPATSFMRDRTLWLRCC
jgi:hypothetical protein